MDEITSEPIFQKPEKIPEKLRDFKKQPEEKSLEKCIYCQGNNVVKRGTRKKRLETIQLYICKDCNKTFTGQKVKGKKYPLKTILDAISFYNTGFSLEESCNLIKENYGIDIKKSSLSDWVEEFESLCTYVRMRKHGKELFTPNQIIQDVKLFHRQVFNFRYHKAKTALILQEYKHQRFEPLREFLESIAVDCPHQYFKEGIRSSEIKTNFDLSQVIIKEKQNFATRIANLVLQAVNDNKQRHEMLQRFMLANDSVTIAAEVPIYMNNDDLEHMKNALKFQIPLRLDSVLTGHIDLIQIRNGAVHLLDFKPNASKQKPIDQLTLYALALSRLTGLRMYDFKCAWFDDKNYYEFFPLHVVYKLRKRPRISKDQTSLNQNKFKEEN